MVYSLVMDCTCCGFGVEKWNISITFNVLMHFKSMSANFMCVQVNRDSRG